jgi:tetratricopeptide (TPR) repeat protein
MTLAHRPDARIALLPLCLAALLASACSQNNAATEEYLAALRGEETGMTRREQLARIEHAIELAPRRAAFRETHAVYSIDVHDFDRAAADLDTAILLDDRPYLRFMRGLVSCQRGLYEASLADFDRAIAEDPRNTQFFRGRSLARSRVGRYAEALSDARHLVAKLPQQAESHHAMGVALAGLRRWPEAVASFDKAMQQRPELIYPLQSRAAAYAAAGDTAHAAADFAEAERRLRDESPCAACRDPFRY